MGTSFVEFRGRGFWTSDSKLEIWLHLLTLAVSRRDERPPWLDEAREHWHEQATVGFTGCVSAALDHWIGDQADRLLTVAELAEDVQHVLRGTGIIRRDDLEAAGIGGPGSTWAADVDAEVVLPVAEAFSALLRGEIVWDSRTSPVL
ncbi:hypothetical protein GCM10009616_40070 [Microlunatus lacustris]